MGSPGEKKTFRRKLVGTVRSAKMDKTVVVEVTRRFAERKYRKYVQALSRYQAHDEKNELWVGDRVEIQEHRPISKNKRWIVTRMIAPAADRPKAAAVPSTADSSGK